MNNTSLSKGQLNSLVILRLFIGWHFLYEGILKLYNPEWTAKGYLVSAQGLFKPFFQWLASDSLIGLVDTVNIVVLMLVGVTLLLGFFEKSGAISGAILLLLYYLAHPAFPGLPQGATEGNYWLVNKNLIEAAALLVIYYLPTSYEFGLQRLLKPKKKGEAEGQPV